MKGTMITNVYESRSIIVAQKIAVPDSQRVITITHCSDKGNSLISLTIIGMTSSEFSIIILGDKFVKSIICISQAIECQEKAENGVDDETLWEHYIVPNLRSHLGGVMKYHVDM